MKKMKHEDITCVYLTASALPHNFATYVRLILSEAIGDTPLISVSREPLNFGHNIIDDGKKCTANIYYQMLRAFRIADTKYVAVAEDDTLYPAEHFSFYRPPEDTFGYNQNRYGLFTWDNYGEDKRKFYHWRPRNSNATLIAPRALAVEALEERFARWHNNIPENIVGELGRGMVDRNMKVTERKKEEKYSKISVVQINHEYGSEDRQRSHRKTYGYMKAYDIPVWGDAEKLVAKYHELCQLKP